MLETRGKAATYFTQPRFIVVLVFLLALLSVFGVFKVSATEQMALEVITLNSTTAEQVLPLIKPFVVPGGTLTGTASQLIIKTTASNLAEIKSVLSKLDVSPRQLRISVSQDIDEQANGARDNISGRLGNRDQGASVRLGRPLDNPNYRQGGATIRYGDKNGNAIAYNGTRTRSNRENHNTHFVTTIEGRPAFIFTGESTPYSNHSYYAGPYGVVTQNNVQHVQTDRGFYVTARTNGNMVTLEISAQLDERPDHHDGSIQSRGTNTIASGRLGEWIAIGGARQSASGNQREILAKTRGYQDSSYDVWVKVEVSH